MYIEMILNRLASMSREDQNDSVFGIAEKVISLPGRRGARLNFRGLVREGETDANHWSEEMSSCRPQVFISYFGVRKPIHRQRQSGSIGNRPAGCGSFGDPF